MKIATIGAGALGCLFGGRFAANGEDVRLLHHRDEYASHVNRNGVHVHSEVLDDAPIHVDVPVTTDAREVGHADLAMVFVGAHQTREAIEEHRACIGPETRVLSLQNGVRNYPLLQELIAPERVLAGIATQGGVLEAPGVVRHTGMKTSVFGGPDREFAARVGELFDDAGFPCEIVDDPRPALWRRQFIKVTLAPLSSLTRLPSHELAESDHLVAVMERLLDETLSVAKAHEVPLEEDSTDAILAAILQWCEEASGHKSSMLQALEAGKRTEIDEMNGAIVEMAAEADVQVPYNWVITDLVRGLEDGYLGTESYTVDFEVDERGGADGAPSE